MKRSLVIIPTYNEAENIASIIDAVVDLDSDFDLLVVDDNSPDGTADIVKGKQENIPSLHLLNRTEKSGLGTAYIAGFRWALDAGYDYVFEMDADFSHNPEDLPRLRSVLESGVYDLVVGSRYITGGDVENWDRDRKFLSRGASYYVQAITWMPIQDPTAGFVGYTAEVLSALDLDKIRFVGYAFQIEMKFASWSLGFRLKEIPITFKDRVLGKSKLSTNIISEAIKGVFVMKFKSFFNDYRKTETA